MTSTECRRSRPYVYLLGLLFVSAASQAAPALYFEPNIGQAADEVRYIARTGDSIVLLTRDGAVFPFVHGVKEERTTSLVRMRFRDACFSEVREQERRASVSNYYLQDLKSMGVAHFGAVEYADVYRGIDVRYRGHEGNVEFDFHVAPRADAGQIVLSFEHATSLRVDASGDLLIEQDGAIVRQKRPVVYQDIDGVRRSVEGRYLLDDERHEVQFALGAYDREHELVIDPQIVYTTYHGGSNFDNLRTVSAHSNGSAYVTGESTSPDFPLERPIAGPGTSNLYVSRFDKEGKLVYSTFFGSGSSSTVSDTAVDPSGNLYLLGLTFNPAFPRTLPSYDDTDTGIIHPGMWSVFLAKLGPLGGLVYSNLISRNTSPSGLAVDEDGFVYAGLSNSGFFACGLPPTPGAANYESSLCVFKVNQLATGSVFRAELGGLRHIGHDNLQALAIDEDHNVYLTGVTGSRDFPTTPGAIRTTYYGRANDGFVAKLADNGALVFSTYFGPEPDPSTLRQALNGIAVAKDKTIYVSGFTSSSRLLTTPGVVKPAKTGTNTNGFLTQINADGSQVLKATYLGGSGSPTFGGDGFFSMGMDASERVVLGGTAYSGDFPVTTPMPTTLNGQMDCFVMRMSHDFKRLDYSALIGGSGIDQCTQIAVNGFRVHIGGYTDSLDLPIQNPRQTSNAGGYDGFLTSYDFEPLPVVFLPGIGGSILKEGVFERWPAPGGDWDQLSLNPAAPGGLIINATDAYRKFYGSFLEYLKARGYREYELHEVDISRLTSYGCDYENQKEQRPNLFVFPYDWRRSISDPTFGPEEQLADYLTCVQEFHPGKKINIVAHSMGGLVTRRMLLDSSQASKVERVVTIGTSWWGAPKAISTLYTGNFLEFPKSVITDGKIKKLSRHFPGLHELLPSSDYHIYALKKAFREESTYEGQLTHAHDYTYDQLVGRLDADMPDSTPGSTGRTFHSYAGQDNWATDDSGIFFTHFVGVQNKNKTIVQIVDRYSTLCKYVGHTDPEYVCQTFQHFEHIKDRGDGTVPFISAWRTMGTLAPNTSRRLVTGEGRLTEHEKLPSDPTVQQETLDILTSASPQPPPSPLRSPTTDFAGSAVSEDEPEIELSPSVYVTIVGGSSVILFGSAGFSTSIDPETGFAGQVPGGSLEATGVNAVMATVNAEGDYRIELVSDGEPMLIQIVHGLTNAEPDLAARYVDAIIPAGVLAEIDLPASGLWTVRYDADADGIYETVVPPTAIAAGGAAFDRTAPDIAFTPNTSSVSIEASDLSGVSRLLYSTDGVHFRLYQNPIPLQPPAVLYAFADDTVGNRSAVYEYHFQAVHASDEVWIDETLPAGANLTHNGHGTLQWDTSHAFTGAQSLVHPNPSEVARQTYIGNLSKPLHIGEKAVAYVWLDPDLPPREIKLTWHTNATYHAAYWGEALLGGEQYAVNMGPLPVTGEWVRLEVPLASLGIEAQTLGRLDLSHFGGRVWFDHIGKSGTACVPATSAHPQIPAGDAVWIDDSLPAGASLQNNSGTSIHWDGSQSASGTQSLVSTYIGNSAYNFFINGLSQPVAIGENVVFYVRLNECAPPSELMIRWYNTVSGYSVTRWGASGSGSEYMGPMPAATGEWVRIEIPASQLRLEQSTVTRLDINYTGGQMWFDHFGKSGTACVPATSAHPQIPAGDAVWIDDSLPAGASLQNNSGTSIHWDGSQSASGTQSLVSTYIGNSAYNFFINGLSQPVAVGENVVFYVRLNECAPPSELMIRWYNTVSGYSVTRWGASGSGSEYMGPMPAATGEWVRIEIPASQLRLEQSTVTRLDINYTGGQMWFDHFGKSGTACVPATSAHPQIPAGDAVWIDDSLPAGASLQNNSGTSIHWDGSQSASGTQSLVSTYIGNSAYNFFINGLSEPVAVGENVVFYVRLNECAPPSELMIRWYNTVSGYSVTRWGASGSGSEYMGPMPAATGEWVRIEIPASQLRLEQSTVTRLDINYTGGQMWFDHFGKSGTACVPATSAHPQIPAGDAVWIDDSLPAGASLQNNSGTSIHWDGSQSASGTQSLVSTYIGNSAYNFFINGLSQPVAIGENVVFYVRLNECAPPSELMIRWYNTVSGYSVTRWGASGSGSEYMGPMPAATGEWVRIEIPASQLRLEQSTVTRLDINYTGGQMWFDHFGKSGTACVPATSAHPQIPAGDAVWIDDSLPAGASLQNNSGTSIHWDGSQSASGTQSLVSTYIGNSAYNFFINGLSQPVAIGENVVFYVRLNECAPPSELMIRWYNTVSGYSVTRWGASGSGSEYMGPMPAATGEWVRIEIPASQLRLEQSTVTRLDINYTGGQMWFDHFGKSGTACIAATAAQPTPGDDETIFVDDTLPEGAFLQNGWGGPVLWDSTQAASGTASLRNTYYGPSFNFSSYVAGLSVPIEVGDKGIVYVLLNECAPPRELKLQWFTNTGGGSAYWGEALIGGESGAQYMGELPVTGQWVRLEVPFADLNLEQSTIWRVELAHYGGQVWFDRIGRRETTP